MDEDDAVDETVMLTRRGRRSRGADAAPPAAGGADGAGVQKTAHDENRALDEGTVSDQGTVSVDERTVAVPRRRRTDPRDDVVPTDADDVVPTDADAGAPVDERTIAIDRRAAPPADAGDDALDDRTVAVSRRRGGDVAPEPESVDDALDDRTVAVSRRRGGDVAPEPESVDDALDDRTVAVVRDATTVGDRNGLDARLGGDEPIEDRIVSIEDRTVSIEDRTVSIEDRTVLIDRTVSIDRAAADEAADDHTVVVDRAAAPASASPEIVSAYAGEDLDATVPAAPPRVVDAEPTPAIYKPRAAPRRPSRPPVIQGGIAPTREFDEQAVSLVRRARRVSLWSLLSVLGACAVSVAGLITLAYFVFA